MKKLPLILSLLLLNSLGIFAQECFELFYEKGMNELRMEDFDTAIKSFKAAKVCGDNPGNIDVDEQIMAAQNGYIDAIQKERNKVKSLYLAMIARKAFDEGDLLLGFRLTEKAYQFDQNANTQELLLNFQENYDKLFRSGRRFKSLRQYPDYYLGEAQDGSVWLFDYWGESYTSLELDNEVYKVNQLEVSSDGKIIATISIKGIPHIWNKDGKLIKTLDIHRGPVYDISISPDNNFLLTASHDQTAALWSADGELIRQLKGHDQPLVAVEFSPDGQFMLTVSIDARSIVWNRNGENVGEKTAIYEDPILEAHFTPDSKNIVAISSSDCVVIYDLGFTEASKREIRPKESKAPETIKDVVITEDGDYVLVLLKNKESADEIAILYNKRGEILQMLQQKDLLWMKIPADNNETILVLTRQEKVMLRKLSERSQKSAIIQDYDNFFRELTEMEKRTFGIED